MDREAEKTCVPLQTRRHLLVDSNASHPTSRLMSASTRTYTTIMALPESGSAALGAYAELFNRAIRTTYAQQERDLAAGTIRAQAERKACVSSDFGLTSRQAYSVLTEADGHKDGILELNKLDLDETKDRLKQQQGRVIRGKKQLAEHKGSKSGKRVRLSKHKLENVRAAIFIASTKVASLSARLGVLKTNIKAERTSLTFGTKKAARQRAALELALQAAFIASDSAEVKKLSHELDAWQAAWSLKRSGQFLVVGSKDETAGCQGCIAKVQDDESFSLSIKMPASLGGERVLISGVRFKYGAEQLRHALAQQALRASSTKSLRDKAKLQAKAEADASQTDAAKPVKISQKEIQGGIAITWRFMRQADGRYAISFTTEVVLKPIVTNRKLGAFGVDLNAGFLTLAQTNEHGNILSSINIMTPDVGLNANQRKARQTAAVKMIIARCVAAGKPLVLEDLDFAKKKRALSARSPGTKRKLSALAYSAIYELFCARAQDHGVEVITVDPSYTSTQGRVCYAARRGWTVHQAAAGVIARRGQGFSEKAPVSGTLRVREGGLAVEQVIPEEIARSDADHRWPKLHRLLQQAIASHYKTRGRRRDGQPRAAKSAGAAVVQGEIPWLKRSSPPPGAA